MNSNCGTAGCLLCCAPLRSARTPCPRRGPGQSGCLRPGDQETGAEPDQWARRPLSFPSCPLPPLTPRPLSTSRDVALGTPHPKPVHPSLPVRICSEETTCGPRRLTWLNTQPRPVHGGCEQAEQSRLCEPKSHAAAGAAAPPALGSPEKLKQNGLRCRWVLEVDTAPRPSGRGEKGLAGFVGSHCDGKHHSQQSSQEGANMRDPVF